MIGYLPRVTSIEKASGLPINKNDGFTLIELVIVIIILGILSVTVTPKFFTSSGFSEYAYRTDVIAKLRLIQTRAMQQANDNCHEVLILSKKLGKGKCSNFTFVDPEVDKKYRSTIVNIPADDPVEFSPNNSSFTFDRMGRPKGCSDDPCDITITGEQSLVVRIESEGYIHAL